MTELHKFDLPIRNKNHLIKPCPNCGGRDLQISGKIVEGATMIVNFKENEPHIQAFDTASELGTGDQRMFEITSIECMECDYELL